MSALFFNLTGVPLFVWTAKVMKWQKILGENELLRQALLSESYWNVGKAAETAGIQRQYLHRLMKESGINANDYKEKRGANVKILSDADR